MPSTYSRVTPYLKARGPPAFSATLPPSVHDASDAGSGGKKSPAASTASCRSSGDDARLDDGDEIVGVDLAHLRHALGRQHDAAARRQAAAGHPRAGAARRDRHAMLARQPQHRDDVVARLGQYGALGRKAAEARFVDEEALEALLVAYDFVGTELSRRAARRRQSLSIRR